MTDNRKRYLVGLLIMAFSALTMLLTAFSYERGTAVMVHYICPLVGVFVGMTLFTGRYRRQIDLWVGAAFVAWYVLSRILMKEMYLEYSFTMFSNLCCAYLLAFPFACGMDDGQKKNGLKAAAAVFVFGYGLLAWLGVFSALLGDAVILPRLGTDISMHKDLRLWAGNHPNISACMFVIALMLGIWLITKHCSRWMMLPVLALCFGAYAGIALADSRTTMLQACCFAAGLVFLGALRLPIKAVWKKALIGLAAGIICFAVVFMSFGWVTEGVTTLANQMTAHAETVGKKVVASRDIVKDMATMTGRTYIYQKIFKLIQDRPRVLLTGMLNSQIVQVLREYTGVDHAHNAYLQTLVNVGLPGLLMAVFFTVRAIWVSMKLIFSRRAAFADQILAVILLVFLVGTIPEPFLFTEYLTIANMTFFLVFGYAIETERKLRQM